ncbi:MAG: response regulator [Acidobacteriia bacterium]|nr:response regulator [Terriglobia bacterium]
MRKPVSLRWKLAALIAGGSVVAALIAAAGFTWLDLDRFWQHTSAEVGAIGNIVADQVAPAITLGDRRAAGEILASLRADHLIRKAVLYDARGVCFARLDAEGGQPCPAAPADGIRRDRAELVLCRAIRADGERLGTLVLAASLPSVPAVVRQYLGGTALIVLLSLLVAALVAMVLQARVSAPILAIANVAERIAATHRFGDRVAVSSSDELGVLARAFNEMLEEIGRSHAELAQQSRSLEAEVAERRLVNAELRLAKEKAEEAARLKGEFLANMSHEIRTPMNGVLGMISLVLDRCSDGEEREQLQVAQTAAQSLLSILNDILDLSKIEAGRMTLEAIDFDLRSTVEESLRMFEIAAAEKGLDLSLAFAPDCPGWVRGDPVRLRQVLINLVGNAVKFTSEGAVRVAVRPSGGGVRIDVADTGIGIEPSKLKSVFEAFTQADGSHTRQFGGTGLGLTITRRLVSLMGGRLWAESEAGKGSLFCVELPLEARPAERPEDPAAEPPPLPPARAGLRVLVAEDNAINQKVIGSMLRRQGWSVTMAGNGTEACQSFLEEPFDLILMDVQMPELDGLEATRRIRREELRRGSFGHIPIIALTAHANQSHHAQCLAAGMDAVITKPVDLKTLLRGIGTVLACAGSTACATAIPAGCMPAHPEPPA